MSRNDISHDASRDVSSSTIFAAKMTCCNGKQYHVTFVRAITLKHWQPFHTLVLFYRFYWSLKMYNIHMYLTRGVTMCILQCFCVNVSAKYVIMQNSRLFNSSKEKYTQIPSYIPMNYNCLNNLLVYRACRTSQSQSKG